MGENFKRFEEVCKKKFNEGSFGILTPIFDPAYPSLKYVFFIFLLIRTVFYICTFSIHDTFLVHAEFIIGIFVIVMSFLANESIEYRHTVLEEPMYFLMPSFGFLILFSLLFACIRGDVSSSYYILIEIDSIFFFYTLYIRVKEIYYKLNRRKYSRQLPTT